MCRFARDITEYIYSPPEKPYVSREFQVGFYFWLLM